METGKPPTFYLFASPTGEPCRSPATVFYKVEAELLAESLCGLFKKEYTDENGQPAFHFIPAESFSVEEQVLLDEALDWLPLYRDPDPGLYDPPPSKHTLLLAQHMMRASAWEELLQQRIEHPSSRIGHVGVERNRTQEARPSKGGRDANRMLDDESEFNKDSPTIGEIPEMPHEEKRNSVLSLLFLFAQAYYKMLECTVSMASWCTALDVELNGYYLWIVHCITNLLKNSEELKDFPVPFEPLFPDLYPATIRDYDWTDMVAPEVEQFLSTVQRYVQSKGIYEPQKDSVGWIFIELYQPSVNAAIEKAIAYNKKVRQYLRQTLGSSSPKADGTAPTTHGEQSARDVDKLKRTGSQQPNMTNKQIDDYKLYEYLCRDCLHIPGTFPRQRTNDISLNGHKLTLGDSLFALLLRLVVELKKGKGGWVSSPALQADGLISNSAHYQPYSNLRTALKGSLKEKDGKKFIEASGSKKYRISVHPDFVTYDKERLLNHPDSDIRQLAGKLP